MKPTHMAYYVGYNLTSKEIEDIGKEYKASFIEKRGEGKEANYLFKYN